ncbi:MAG: methionine adenosyltransferase [Candidatus Cloacimonadaceae bacterium]|jgi:S-adenosylmethionine synthetase|nr:methionine adenosyltransferase [Candidatus Cloacimonadaceae bacterium]
MTALHAKTAGPGNGYIFTSESVSEGHPDKVCDQISDAILDAYLGQHPLNRVACETLTTKDTVILSGEITSQKTIDVEPIVRDVIRKIGYTHPDKGFDHNCRIINLLHEQEGDLARNEGAGDQGLMFGYACNQTKSLMPIPIEVAHQLLYNLAQARKMNEIECLLPDAKSQVSFRFEGRKPKELETLVISTHHQSICEMGFEDLKQAIIDKIVYPTINEMENEVRFDAAKLKVLINPLGRWHDGGPAADTGLTGRKIIVDTYGGWAQHGGGAFSGKDPTKVDRSAAYMARHVAKSIVGSHLADECLIQFSFVIGDKAPVSVMVETFGSGKMPDHEIERIITREFDLTVKGIIDYLDLRTPIYLPTASYGHFGLNTHGFSWEKIKKLV